MKSIKVPQVPVSKTLTLESFLKKNASSTIKKIQKFLICETRLVIDLGHELGELLECSINHFCEKERTDLLVRKAHRKFFEYIQAQFKLEKTRANEYMKVATRKDVRKLRLPIGVLIELARLDEPTLKKYLESHPSSDLKKLPLREIKKTVRLANPNRKVRPEKSVVVKLKATFDKVKEKFENATTLEPEIDSTLKEIATWYQEKSSTQKVA